MYANSDKQNVHVSQPMELQCGLFYDHVMCLICWIGYVPVM